MHTALVLLLLLGQKPFPEPPVPSPGVGHATLIPDTCPGLELNIDPGKSYIDPETGKEVELGMKTTCRVFIPLPDFQQRNDTKFFIKDETNVQIGHLYTNINLVQFKKETKTHRIWWTLGLKKKEVVTRIQQQGMYIAGLPGHTIRWSIS